MKKISTGWFDWYNEEATNAERYLFNRIEELGDLFGDMLFEKGSASYSLISCSSQREENGSWEEDEMGLPDLITNFTYEDYRTNVSGIVGSDGYYDHENQIICLPPGAAQDDASILHEMIHLHEMLLSELEPYFHDIIFWALYQDLRKKIHGLDTIINEHAHVLNESQLYKAGGSHDILFLLKSLDLDLCMGYPLGRIFAYGAEEFLSEREENKTEQREVISSG